MILCDDPKYSPWGEVDRSRFICPGVFEVTTPAHGGIMIRLEIADKVLSKEAQKCGVIDGSYICFEEDCDAPVAIRELLDKGLQKAPVDDYYKEGDYSNIINRSLQKWHPEYWKYHEEQTKPPTKAKKNRDREER